MLLQEKSAQTILNALWTSIIFYNFILQHLWYQQHGMHAITVMHNLMGVSINIILISQLKIILYEKFMFPLLFFV